MGKLAAKVKDATKPLDKKRSGPVWLGPEVKDGGISFSLLSRFICCRERFRLLVVEGLKPAEKFNPKIEYGSMWHEGEEAFAANKNWEDAGLAYAKKLAAKYPLARDDIDHWLSLFYSQFPAYVEYWKRNPEVLNRTPLFQEQVFNVPYRLPSGRIVYLRGKWDCGDIITENTGNGIYIGENKTKSQIDQQKMSRQLTYDLQTMIYVIALSSCGAGDADETDIWKKQRKVIDGFLKKGPLEVKGVRYNVIRRSAHKSAESMTKKMTEDIANGRGQEWFSRWNVAVSPLDIENFKTRTLNPLLEQLCDWWGWIQLAVKDGHSPFAKSIHWQHPFGVYNVLDEGGSSDLDAYIESGSTIGLQVAASLFTELE